MGSPCIECRSRNTEIYRREDGRGFEKRCHDCGYQSSWHDGEEEEADNDPQSSLEDWT
jgi:translation initiation factor 2 beta subunit (eIF-2beta)/eIF-5